MRIAPSRTWFLAALAAVVACLGWNAFLAEEDPNDSFLQDRTESVLYLYLDAPGGTNLDSSASPAALAILLERYTWEIWRQPSTGVEEYRHARVAPEPGAMVALTRSPETGSLADSILITGDDGRAWTTFAPGGASGAVTVQASAGESNASLCFNFSPTSSPVSEEQWSYSRTEATLTATLTSHTSTDQVTPGENRDLSLAVAYETWDVEYSSAGNSRTVNHTSAPAVGAFVSWSVAMGDGYVAGGAMTDDSGQCPATLTVGSSGGNVRAEVSFSTGSATSASLAFSTAPRPSTSNWSLVGSKLVPTLSGISPPSGVRLAPGEFARISGTLQGDVWDLWSDGTQEESRYSYTTPLAWTTLLAEIQHGGGSLDSSSPTTQGDGSFSTGYTMGGASSRVDLRLASTSEWLTSVDFALSEAPPAVEGSDPGAWAVLYPDGGYAIQNLTVDGPTYDLRPGEVRTIGGTLYWVSWEVMTNGAGAIEHRINSSSPVAGASLSAGMEYGDATLSSTYLTTGSLGEFSTIMTMGGQESKVTFSSSGSASATASMAFTPPQASGDQGVKIADESLISVAFESDTAADAATLQPGENVPLRARVLSTSWEVWQNAAGSTELRNHEIRPAIGAIVNFSQVSGPGLMSSTQAETNADGIASVDFMLGAGVSLLRADASFISATASAEARVSPGIWVYDSSQDELELSLSLHGWIETPNAIGATLQVRTTEIWRNLATEATESRQVSYSPAENASIAFNVLDGGNATFGASPSFTDHTGNTITEYRSNGAVKVAATATFSGKTITATMQAPQGWGLAGTDGGGTNRSGTEDTGTNVQGNQTTGSVNGNTTNSGNRPDSGGNNTTNPVNLPSIVLKGRSHWTSGGDGAPEREGIPEQIVMGRIEGDEDSYDAYLMYQSLPGLIDHGVSHAQEATGFNARLTRDVYDFEGTTVVHTLEETISGDYPDDYGLVDTKIAEGWVLVHVDYSLKSTLTWWVERSEIIPGVDSVPAWGCAFDVNGLRTPGGTTDVLANIANEYRIRDLYDQAGTQPDPAVFLEDSVTNYALSDTFSTHAVWTKDDRLTYGTDGHPAPDQVTSASFTSGIAPYANTSEFWLQAEQTLPANTEPIERRLALIATSRDANGTVMKRESGEVVFKISEGVISNEEPVVEGLSEHASWVRGATDDGVGVLIATPPVQRGRTNEVRLLPIDITGHRRGTFNAPGAVSASGTFGKETVLLENADRDEGSATQRDMDTATLDKANDDDLVKVVLSFPANTKPAGVGLKLKHEGMKVDGTKTTFDSAVVREGESRLNFYDDQGKKLTDADLKIDDLANPGNGYMANIVTAGTLTLFIEGGDNFGMVGTDVKSQNSAKYMGGALLTLEMTGVGAAANSGPRLLVFRGGFMHYRHPNGQPGEIGTLEFRDGKGRVTNDDTDLGAVIKTWIARSGKPGGAAYNVEDGNGHIPPGWRLIYERDDFTGTQPNQQEGKGSSLVVKQGSYCRWTQDDNAPGYTNTYIYRANDENDSQIGKPVMPDGPSPDGQTIMFKFQTEVIPPTSAANRSQIQFHPDGKKDGSAGCISIQSYDDCKEVYRYLHDYNALKVRVDLE